MDNNIHKITETPDLQHVKYRSSISDITTVYISSDPNGTISGF